MFTDASLVDALPDATDTLRRRYLGRRRLNDNPKVETITRDGKPAVEVALSGRHGLGKKMVLDADVWPFVRDDLGAAWSLCPNGNGNFYVSGRRSVTHAATGQANSSPRAGLSRLLADAKPGEVVVFLNADPLDLRLANLLRLPRLEAARWRRDQAAKDDRVTPQV
jgi:hypothetical protein